MYFYYTDAKRIYAKRGDEDRVGFALRHGSNGGWLKTGEIGEYEINTTKPVSDPTRTEPARIHAIIKVPPQRNCYNSQNFIFKDGSFMKENFSSGTSGITKVWAFRWKKTTRAWN